MGYKRGSLRHVTSCLALDDIGQLFVCGDAPLVLKVLFIFSTYSRVPNNRPSPRLLIF